jgi:hypothetical protein
MTSPTWTTRPAFRPPRADRAPRSLDRFLPNHRLAP